MNRLRAVKISNKLLKKKTNPFTIPCKLVNFKITKVITIIEKARIVKNPVFIPKIKKTVETNSLGFATDKFVRSIFSGDWNLGTLRTVLIKNRTNKDTDTVLRWFCSRGNLKRIALPKKIPWDNPIANVLKITINWIKGSFRYSATIGINAINFKRIDSKIWVSYQRCLKNKIQKISKFNISYSKIKNMQKIIFTVILLVFISITLNQSYAQEIGLTTFQESAQIIIDEKISQTNIISITLLSSNIQEIKIPMELEQKIRDNGNIEAIVITNQNNCVLGVIDQSCILINIERNPEDKGITAIQESSRETAELFIDEVNELFDTNAKFFQVYIHSSAETNNILDTSGVISGTGTISTVYTMPMEDTYSMYQKLSAMLISSSIRENGGFYDVAKTLSMDENSKMSFSIIPTESKTLLQLRLSTTTPIEDKIESGTEINPLEFFKLDEITRSNYFSTGNFPLNSIFQIIILSDEETNVSDVKGNILPTQIIDGINMPIELTTEGWIFDPDKGEQIQGKFIFGERSSINEVELQFSLGGDNIKYEEPDESIIVVGIIAIVSIGAAIFYLKGYKK